MIYPENIEEIKSYAKEIGIDSEYLLGKVHIGNLDFADVLEMPNNVTINVEGDIYANDLVFLPSNSVFCATGKIYLDFIQEIDDVVTISCAQLWLNNCPAESIFDMVTINCNDVHYGSLYDVTDIVGITWALFKAQNRDKLLVDFMPDIAKIVPGNLTIGDIFDNEEYNDETGIAYTNKYGRVVVSAHGCFLRISKFVTVNYKTNKDITDFDIRENISMVDKI